ncbi:Origin recognition complex subunit 3 [Entamoeba marina]
MSKNNVKSQLESITKGKKKGHGSRDNQLLIAKIPIIQNVSLHEESSEPLFDDNDDNNSSINEIDPNLQDTVLFAQDNDYDVLFTDEGMIQIDKDYQIKDIHFKTQRDKTEDLVIKFPLTKEAKIIRDQYIKFIYNDFHDLLMNCFYKRNQHFEDWLVNIISNIHNRCVNMVIITGADRTNHDYIHYYHNILVKYGQTFSECSYEDASDSNENCILVINDVNDKKVKIERLWRTMECARRGLLVIVLCKNMEAAEAYIAGHDYPLEIVGNYSLDTNHLITVVEDILMERTVNKLLPIIHPIIVVMAIQYYRDFHQSFVLFVDLILRHIEHSIVFSQPSLLIPDFTRYLTKQSNEELITYINEVYTLLSILFSRLLSSAQYFALIHFKTYSPPYTSILKLMDVGQRLDNFNCPSSIESIQILPGTDDILFQIIDCINQSISDESFTNLINYIAQVIGEISSFQKSFPEKMECCCVSILLDFPNLLDKNDNFTDMTIRSLIDFGLLIQEGEQFRCTKMLLPKAFI